MATVRDILKALDVITGGRVITDSFGYGGANPFVVTKTSYYCDCHRPYHI